MDPSLYFIQDLALILLLAAVFGTFCRWLGLSPVVGYLSAGLVLGTPEIAFPYVTDEGRIEVIAQLGVVFLMFGIGLQLRIKRLLDLGIGVVFATFTTALLVLTAGRMAGDLLGLSGPAGLFLAAIFMVSSSAVIGKVLEEGGLGHFRFGRLALGVTLLEDIVAVILLAILGSYVTAEASSGGTALALSLAKLAGFAGLTLVLGLLFMPRLLAGFERRREMEIASIAVAALLLVMAVLAVRAGYSLAFGAFLFGLVVAETRQRSVIERSFQGLKDLFLTVFFVTIGMLVEVRAIPGALHWIALGTVGALLGRSLAAFASLVLAGENPRSAFQAALCLSPIGEFSFIIAGVAVASGLFSSTFQVAAVGTALATSLLSPLIMVRAERLSAFLERDSGIIARLNLLHGRYVTFLKWVKAQTDTHILWRLLRRRVYQIGREILLVSALLLFAEPVLQGLTEGVNLPAYVLAVAFWSVVGLVCLVLLGAIWRNLSAAALIVADYLSQDSQTGRSLAGVLSWLLHLVFVALLGLWLWNLLPSGLLGIGLLLASLVFVALAWRSMIHWQSRFEIALQASMEDGPETDHRLVQSGRVAGWNLNAEEFTLPDETALAGMRLTEVGLRERFGVSVAGIERSGHSLRAVGPQTHLFPGDRLLLLGSPEDIRIARAWLGGELDDGQSHHALQDLVLQSLVVGAGSRFCGRRLKDLDLSRRLDLQVVGMRSGEEEQIPPDPKRLIAERDEILLLSTHEQFERLIGEEFVSSEASTTSESQQ